MSGEDRPAPVTEGGPALARRKRHHRRSRHPVIRALRISIGTILILVSPASVVIPGLMGWVMVLLGLSLLSTEWRPARKAMLSMRLRIRAWRRSWRRS
jgi:hypothetical protein